jgi:hypothetical protein
MLWIDPAHGNRVSAAMGVIDNHNLASHCVMMFIGIHVVMC